MTAFLPRAHTRSTTHLRTRINPFTRRASRGNMLVYAALAILLGSVGVAYAFNVYQQSRAEAVQTGLQDTMRVVLSSAQTKLGAPYRFASVNTTVAIANGVFPDNWVNTARTAVTSPETGAITVADNNSVLAETGTVTAAAVPAARCSSLVSATHEIAVAVKVGTTDVKTLAAPTIDPAALSTACNGAATVPIVYTIARS